ncbi:MAG: WYL domain-containing protein [Salinibacterium sp.]|nr:WYL domain-containing protein [Salinibacterium sp.]
MAATVKKIPPEERLFSLVLALLATDGGLTKAEILSTVQGYRQRYQIAGDNATLERQFERDKDEMRELGIPLETIDSPGDPGNNHNLRYLIPRGSYELPADIRFTPEETTLLGLAALVWREGSLSADARRALLKLRSLGITATEPLLGYAPRLSLRDAAFTPLNAALEKHVLVAFGYLKPGESAARERLVAPLALFQHQGRWHLFAEEPGSKLTKTFLLRRIVSAVTVTSTAFPAPPPGQGDRAIAELDAVWNANLATVEVEVGSDAAARLSTRRGSTLTTSGALEVHYADANILADELAGFGPEVVVISPGSMRDAVIERLERAAADHG